MCQFHDNFEITLIIIITRAFIKNCFCICMINVENPQQTQRALDMIDYNRRYGYKYLIPTQKRPNSLLDTKQDL